MNLKNRYCLGIESTAHTFSIGIVDFDGNTLAIAGDMYKPEEGGLHPRKVVEHHNQVFLSILKKALNQARLSIHDINLIAFSQGPGLGPCLRIGAAVGRSLALKLQIPIVGVNHCIGHTEIGRKLSGALDPLTLYVSGGNTMITGFQNNKYRVFGETLDIAVGNLIDMVARDLGIPHPGGPRLEKMAKNSSNYIPLPYVVKGMDLSFSGIYTACRNLILSEDFRIKYNANDIAFSLEETVYSMLAEVTERAIAHTQKKEILLTGGVAANKNLTEKIRYIAEEHGAQFYSVPLRFAGDNGAFIAWTGILYYLNKGGMEINKTLIDPKWRIDEVFVPWRLKKPKFTGMEEYIHNKKQKVITRRNENSWIPEGKTEASISNLKLIQKGAEAEIFEGMFFEIPCIIKHRTPKRYRIRELDNQIRAQRTLDEARIINKIKKRGIPAPIILDINPELSYFTMTKINGRKLKEVIGNSSNSDIISIFKSLGRIVAKLHKAEVIHGDLTTSNVIINDSNKLFLIDFGLSYATVSSEDRAVDIHLLKRVITSTHGDYYNLTFPSFLEGYSEVLGEKTEEIMEGIEDIELRGRYIKKDKRKRGKIKK